MKRRLFFCLISLLGFSGTQAGLVGQVKTNWLISYVPACYKLQKEMAANVFLSDERLSKYCTCMGTITSESALIDNELVIRIEKKEATYPVDLNKNASKHCALNWEKFSSGAVQRSISPNGNGLFNGEIRRFTAFKQAIFTKEWVPLERKEFPNGSMIMDINILAGRSENTAIDITNHVVYNLTKVEELTPVAKTLGYDFQFLSANGGPALTFNTENGLLTTDYLNPETGKIYQTFYIDSNVLVCASLTAAKDKIQGSMLTSIIKEALLIAVKSRAGASYSGGSFYGSTTNGVAVSGTYTQYNNSWMGEHYSRGLDAVFNGTANASQIDEELNKLNCR